MVDQPPDSLIQRSTWRLPESGKYLHQLKLSSSPAARTDLKASCWGRVKILRHQHHRRRRRQSVFIGESKEAVWSTGSSHYTVKTQKSWSLLNVAWTKGWKYCSRLESKGIEDIDRVEGSKIPMQWARWFLRLFPLLVHIHDPLGNLRLHLAFGWSRGRCSLSPYLMPQQFQDTS